MSRPRLRILILLISALLTLGGAIAAAAVASAGSDNGPTGTDGSCPGTIGRVMSYEARCY